MASKENFISELIRVGVDETIARQFADTFMPEGGTVQAGGRAFGFASDSIGQYNAALLESKNSFDSLNSSVVSGTAALGQMTKAFGALGGNIPVIGGAFEAIGSTMESAFGFLATGFETLTNFASDTLGSVDEITRFHRDLDRENFNLAKSFGQNFEDAQFYTDRFVMNMATYAGLDYGFLNSEELSKSLQGFQNLNVSVDEATSTVRVGSREMDLYAAAVLQAGAMNMETRSYLSLLNDAMAKQGVSAQEAMEQIATFSDIAESTGLNVDTVSRTLNQAASGFTKLGMSADFGRPLLEGLARTMSDLGLGIENATGLTADLSGALAGLTTDYAAAFVTQQRSGMDFGGGGGLLGASIGLQAQMLEAEQTGDQAGMARMLTNAMSDTISSFTGGDIVTASQAANDPSLQTAFFTQQQLLGSQYGINDAASQTRILDYLDQLETARTTGDEDAAALLERQIEEEIQGRDATLGEMEKLNTQINAMLMQSRLQTRNLTVMAAGLGSGFRSGITDLYGAGIQELTGMLNQIDDDANEAIRTGALTDAQAMLENPLDGFMEMISNANITGLGTLEPTSPPEFEQGRVRDLNVQIQPFTIVLQNEDGTERGRYTHSELRATAE